MSLTHAILGVLEARPMNGYELAQFFDASASWVWSAPRSQIYPQLRKMEEDGLVVAESQIRGTKLERREYSITETGAEELRRWVSTPLDTTMKRDPVLLQALFFDLIAPETAVKILEHIIDEQQTVISEWEDHARRLREKNTPLLIERLKRRPANTHERIATLKAHVFTGGVALARARLEWAREGIRFVTADIPTKKGANGEAPQHRTPHRRAPSASNRRR